MVLKGALHVISLLPGDALLEYDETPWILKQGNELTLNDKVRWAENELALVKSPFILRLM